MTTATLAALLARLEAGTGPETVAMRPGLETAWRLAQATGHPQKNLDTVHVAGTNGKGSVVAFLSAMVQASGLAVGRYTSPHLSRYNERIQINDRPLDDPALVTALQQVLAAQAGQPASYFELTTAAAFVALDRALPQGALRPALVETGLGGRLDATNILRPCLSVITSVGLDHQAWLGETLPLVAWEKAGILKSGVPAVADPVAPEAVRVIEAQARRRGVPLWLAERDFTLEGHGERRLYRDRWGSLELPTPVLPGEHQWRNAALAVAAGRILAHGGWPISPDALRRGLTGACWPGRLERCGENPEWWLDGAHNPAAARALADFLRQRQAQVPGRRVRLLFSALDDKDHEGMAEALAPVVQEAWVVPLPGPRGQDAHTLAQPWIQRGIMVYSEGSWLRAVEMLRADAQAGDCMVVCGSLRLVALVRESLQPAMSSFREGCGGSNES
ncbi:MAG: bifunctional folylpolyglutamate synthase/dihydrofolate synthase [Magnetococcus sp. WYHC-3]